MKFCSRCKENKPTDAFFRRGVKHLRAQCKPCEVITRKEARHRNMEAHRANTRKNNCKFKSQNPEYQRDFLLQAKYGITIEQYDELLARQGNGCAICKCPPLDVSRNGGKIRLAVDHDHVTGKVRGLLCWHCNTAIGKLKDSPELIAIAAAYIRPTFDAGISGGLL